MEKTRNELEVLNNRFIWLYRQKRYPEAPGGGEGFRSKQGIAYLNQPYRNIFKTIYKQPISNLKAAVKSDTGLQEGLYPAPKEFRKKIYPARTFLAVCMFCAFLFSALWFYHVGQAGRPGMVQRKVVHLYSSLSRIRGPSQPGCCQDRCAANPKKAS